MFAACGSGSSHAPDLAANSGDGGASPGATARSWAGKTPAPAFPTGLTWFNVQHPLTLDELQGKAVLLDFWTLGCINCQHIIPDLDRLEQEFGAKLVIIGVHSGKYSAEHDDQSIEDAIKEFGIDHPVVNDPDFAFWNAYGANAWPTLVLIDPTGKIVGAHAGEGVYGLFRPIIASLLNEFKGRLSDQPIPVKLNTTATSTVLSFPGDVLPDPSHDRLFIADSGHNRILVADMAGKLESAIGDGKAGFADGGAAEAEFRQPQGLALSEDGKTLYVADTRNHAIREVDLASGVVTTIAGTGQQLEQLPSAGAKAKTTALSSPWGLAIHGETLYIAMAGVHQLWAMDLTSGSISVYAGTSREGIDDGPRLSQATLAQPSGMTIGGNALYWADPESSSVRTIDLAKGQQVDTLTGTGLFSWGDKDGKGKDAELQHAQGVAYESGKLYIADTYNMKVKVLDLATDEVTTIAGSGRRGWKDGPGAQAEFDEPSGIGAADGKVYVADTDNNLIRVIDPKSGEVTTLTLTNAGAISGSAGVKATRISLPPQTVAPGTANLRISVNAPASYQLNSQAPSQLQLMSANSNVVQLGESSVHWATDETSVSLPVPVTLQPGQTSISAQASIYYCREGEQALCFIGQFEFTIPVTVQAGAEASEVTLDYTLPRT
jgi:DNA-binding beta-propeller fold protein YncE